MLQLAHRTSAPRARRVSISTAVWTVMCREPVMRAPASGRWSAYSARRAMRPGISTSASSISLRPHGARDRSATLNSGSASAMAARYPASGRAQLGLELAQDGHRAGVYALAGGQLQGQEVAEDHQVQQLGQVPVALAPDLLHPGDHLTHDLCDQLEAADDLGVLGVVAQVDQGEQLPGGVAELAPAHHLVVAKLRVHGVERRGLGVLVDLGLPPQGGGRAHGAGAVDEGDRPADALGQPGSWSRRRLSWVTAWAIHCLAPGKSPISSRTTRGGMAMAPRPARGWGMVVGTGTTGAPHPAARLASSPPPVTATTEAPCTADSVAASRVSSVSPENDTANTRVPSPTKAGGA